MFDRRSTSDPAIGWISTVDSLLLGFGLMVVLALHSAMTQQKMQTTAEADKKDLGQAREDLKGLKAQALALQSQVNDLKGLQAESDTTVARLNADLGAMSRSRDELNEHVQWLNEQLDAEAQGSEGISQQLGQAIRERDSLKKRHAECERQLAATRSEIESLVRQLAQANATATATQEERDSLQARLNEMQALLLTLEDRQQHAVTQSEDLKQEADRLKTAFDDSTRTMQGLRADLSAKERELSKLMADQAEAESLLKRTRTEAAQLRSQLDESERKLAVANKDKDAVAREQQILETEKRDLQKTIAGAQAATENGKQLRKQLESKIKELDILGKRLREAEDARQSAEARSQKDADAKGQAAATDVLGFKGRFGNVVFVIDISHSMTHISDPGRPGFKYAKYNPARWNKTKREIVSWARNLPMKTLRLVLFHSEVFEHPGGGGFYPMVGIDRGEAVRQIEGLLNDVTPDGQTNTLAALERAYGYADIDTMILFTDGSPVVQGRESAGLVAAVRALVRKHRDIPVNVVGIGEYFEKSFADFLRDIASTTGGEFIGR